MNNQADLLEKPTAADPAPVGGDGLPEGQRLTAKIEELLGESDELAAEIRQRRQLLRVARAETELAETPDIKDFDQIDEMASALAIAEQRAETIKDAIEAARSKLAAIASEEKRARRQSALVVIAELAKRRIHVADELAKLFLQVEAATAELRQLDRETGEQGRIANIIVPGSLRDGRRLRRGLIGELTKVAPTFSATIELSRMHRAAGLSEYLASLDAASIDRMIAEHDAESTDDRQAA